MGALTRLDHLTVLAHSTVWSPGEDLDWDQDVKRPWWMGKAQYAGLISQMMYGERLSFELITGPLGAGQNATETAFLKTQAVDEARHVDAYSAYLARLGDITPREDGFDVISERVRGYDGPRVAVELAIHSLLEGDALMLQKNFQDWLPCPLLRELHQRVSRDESRHVSYGKAILPARVAALTDDEKHEVAVWLEETWRASFHALAGRFASPLVLNRRTRAALADRFWQPHQRRLAELGLMEIET